MWTRNMETSVCHQDWEDCVFEQKSPLIERIVEGQIKTAALKRLLENYGSRMSLSGTKHDQVFSKRRFLWTLPLSELKAIVEFA